MTRIAPLAALTLLLALVLAAPAPAATTRTSKTPAQLRAGKKAYEKKIRQGWATATKKLDHQLRKHPYAPKPTAVLDIDETTMSNWSCLDDADFNLVGLAICAASGKSVAFPSAKRFIKHARRHGVRIAFITGTPQALCATRRKNLIAQGIKAPFSLTCKPADYTQDSLVPYKSGARRALVKKGRTIVLNIGDQHSDLAGGYARAKVKLPNPIYVTT